MSIWKKIKRWIKKNIVVVTAAVIILFPLVIGLIYAIPVPQIIAIDSGDLIGFYATALGIFGSFITYRAEKNKAAASRKQELKPRFSIEVSAADEIPGLFDVRIEQISEKPLSYITFYDCFVAQKIGNNYSFSVMYNQPEKVKTEFGLDYIITEADIIDVDGYPKYVQVGCDDVEGNIWDCVYNKMKSGEHIIYYPEYVCIH